MAASEAHGLLRLPRAALEAVRFGPSAPASWRAASWVPESAMMLIYLASSLRIWRML